MYDAEGAAVDKLQGHKRSYAALAFRAIMGKHLRVRLIDQMRLFLRGDLRRLALGLLNPAVKNGMYANIFPQFGALFPDSGAWRLLDVYDKWREAADEVTAEAYWLQKQLSPADRAQFKHKCKELDTARALTEFKSKLRKSIGVRLRPELMQGDGEVASAAGSGGPVVVGRGYQTPQPDVVQFCVAPFSIDSPLEFFGIKRREPFGPTTGCTIGFVVDTRLCNVVAVAREHDNAVAKLLTPHPADGAAATGAAATGAAAMTPAEKAKQQQELESQTRGVAREWCTDVLRAPVAYDWRVWLMQHTHIESTRNVPSDTASVTAAHCLAQSFPLPRARNIMLSRVPAPPCLTAPYPLATRQTRLYGVVCCRKPDVTTWTAQGVHYIDVDVDPKIESQEGMYRRVIGCFKHLTTHVIVRGFRTILDLTLKWFCEYTARYSWRFILLVECATVDNVPETRDRVQNLLPIGDDVATRHTFPIEYLNGPVVSRNASYLDVLLRSLPRYQPQASRKTTKVFNFVHLTTERVRSAKFPRVVLHLVSAPGAGKSFLMSELQSMNKHDASGDKFNFVFFDCSDDRLVMDALVSLLDASVAGVEDHHRTVLVADEFHMLDERKKNDFLEWVSTRLDRIKVVMIANRADYTDDNVLAAMHAKCPDAVYANESNMGSGKYTMHGRISCGHLLHVARRTIKLGDTPEQAVCRQAVIAAVFCVLRNLLSDDSVSLRLLPVLDDDGGDILHRLAGRLSDKLVNVGPYFIGKICVLAQSVLLRHWRRSSKADLFAAWRQLLSAGAAHDTVGIEVLVFVALLPMLQWQCADHGVALHALAQGDSVSFDHTVTFKEFTAPIEHIQLVHPALRLTMWVEFVVSEFSDAVAGQDYAGRALLDAVLEKMRTLRMVDHPDFPVVLAAGGRDSCPMDRGDVAYVPGTDLTNLKWILDSAACGRALDWRAIGRAWAVSPVTDTKQVKSILKNVPPATVFAALTPSNLLQLLRNGPDLHKETLASYPLDRIDAEAAEYVSPWMFALWDTVVAHSDLARWREQPLAAITAHLADVRLDASNTFTRGVPARHRALRFLRWVGEFGSQVVSVPDSSQERQDVVVAALVELSQELMTKDMLFHADGSVVAATKEIADELAELWCSHYFAPLADVALLPLGVSYYVAGRRNPPVDSWPAAMKALHRAVQASAAMPDLERVPLTSAEATELVLRHGVLAPRGQGQRVPSRLVASLMQAEEAGWLELAVQLAILACPVEVADAATVRANDGLIWRNMHQALSGARSGSDVKILGNLGDRMRRYVADVLQE